jgi:hypothetical protein
MIQIRKLISVLCLLLVTWSLVAAPISGSDLVVVLPLIGILLIALLSLSFLQPSESDFVVLGPSLSSVSLRAPPRQ